MVRFPLARSRGAGLRAAARGRSLFPPGDWRKPQSAAGGGSADFSPVVEVLHDLGIETIGQLTALPRETLPSRFGPEIVRRLDQAFGQVPEPIACQRPFELPEASWGCEPPIEGRPAIEAVLRRLLVRVTRRLQSRNEGILQFDVDLNVPERRAGSILGRPGAAHSQRKAVAGAGALQLERVRLRGKVGGVRVCVIRSAPLDVEQSTLFDAAGAATPIEIWIRS